MSEIDPNDSNDLRLLSLHPQQPITELHPQQPITELHPQQPITELHAHVDHRSEALQAALVFHRDNWNSGTRTDLLITAQSFYEFLSAG